MWPIQLDFFLFTVCRLFFSSLTLCNTSSFLTRSVQLIIPNFLQHHISKSWGTPIRICFGVHRTSSSRVELTWLITGQVYVAVTLWTCIGNVPVRKMTGTFFVPNKLCCGLILSDKFPESTSVRAKIMITLFIACNSECLRWYCLIMAVDCRNM